MVAALVERWVGIVPGSEVLAFVTDVFQFLFSDDLRLPNRDYGFTGRRPDEAPGTCGDCPETLPRLHVEQGEGIVAVFGADRDEQTRLGGGVFGGVSHPPATHHFVSVVHRYR